MADLLQTGPLPFSTHGVEHLQGEIKHEPEDFEVDEIPAYQPSGEGEFLYLWIEKRDLSGPFLIRLLSKELKINEREIGMAGFKDRRAVTRQWVSLPCQLEKAVAELKIDGFKILQTTRHGNKLRTGHLHGNRFNILFRTADPQRLEKVQALTGKLKTTGLWNFYGEQRFGKEKETLAAGLDLINGGKGPGVPKNLRKFAYSAVQSALFNEVLRTRIHSGLEKKVISGDVLAFLPQEKCCKAMDLSQDQVRVDQGAMAITGPMPGWKMYPATESEALAIEARVIQNFGFTNNSWKMAGQFMTGARRPLVYPLPELNYQMDSLGVRFTFSLPAGAYATQLLREIAGVEECRIPGD